jgi:hypothetical protein
MFRTELITQPSQHKIALTNSLLTIGSCFAEAIGNRLHEAKFKVSVNPFGTTYNPISIHNLLLNALADKSLADNAYVQQQDVHLNYHLHSSFSALSKTELQQKINVCMNTVLTDLNACDTLLITYGTAWVYKRKEEGDIVNNCHKQVASLFNKALLTEKEIEDSFDNLYQAFKKTRPNLRVILTLSPVRHIKDTLELNAVSKAILRTSCYRISQRYTDVDYFPAYEIMMDDLRDYRFYKSDMLHPTTEAEDYIWGKFAQTYFEADTIAFIKKWKEIKAALAHKPFHPSSAAHQQFLKSLYTKVSELKNMVNVEEELLFIKSQITGNL